MREGGRFVITRKSYRLKAYFIRYHTYVRYTYRYNQLKKKKIGYTQSNVQTPMNECEFVWG